MVLSALAEQWGGMTLWTYIGYAASVIVLLSYATTSVVKLRWVSTCGSALFSLYGFMIGSIPTGFLNLAVMVVNLYHLLVLRRRDELVTVRPVPLDDPFLQDFLQYNGKDIHKWFPDFSAPQTDADLAVYVCRNTAPAGVLLGKNLGGGVLQVELDYACAAYRDCRVGEAVYPYLAQMGYTRLCAATNSEKHGKYLLSMGFEKQDGQYVKVM